MSLCTKFKVNVYISHNYWFTTALVSIRHAQNSEYALIRHSNTFKYSNARLFLDLMKCSVEHESLSYNNWYVLSKRKRL